MNDPLHIGIIGMGGFAGSNHDAVKQLEADGRCKLICACDPNVESFTERMAEWDLVGRGVRVFGDYIEMLDACRDTLDVVTIPTPVPLHAPMHRACVERGLAAYLEKPPTLDYAELDEMLRVEERAVKLTNVGFSFIVDRQRRDLKRRILDGEFGKVRKVCFCGLSPRYVSYYRRAPWAGRLMMDGRLVLDSCMGNALAHYTHNTLFWAGTDGVLSWGEVREVEAELYRAHDIEGTDTIFARAVTAEGLEVRAVFSHACSGAPTVPEWIVCENAVVHFTNYQGYRIAWNDGREETGEVCRNIDLYDNLLAYFDYVTGKTARPATRLIDSRPFVQFHDLVYIASGGIATVPEEAVTRAAVPEGSSETIAIDGIRDIADEFFRSGKFPSGQGIGWARPGGRASSSDLPKLKDVVVEML